MSEPGAGEEPWADAVLAAELFAVDPFALGGIVLRGGPGDSRDTLCAWLRGLLPEPDPEPAPWLRVPLHITDDRLLGGLSLAATLRAGRPVLETGVLARAHGGALVLAMAERLESRVISHLCAVLDRGELALERDGLAASFPCRLGVVALDEGLGEERLATPLRDRLALQLDLALLDPRRAGGGAPDRLRVQEARRLLPGVALGEEIVEALCRAALALGIDSLRAPLLAAAAARVHAALEGRVQAEDADAAAAARLVLGHRATRMPQFDEEPVGEEEAPGEDESEPERQPDDPAADPPPPIDDRPDESSAPDLPEPPKADPGEEDPSGEPPPPLEEILLEAAKSAVPKGLLDALAAGAGRVARQAPRSAGRAGALRASMQGGRPAGVRAGWPRAGERLNLVETLRAAAPWQRLRRPVPGAARELPPRRVELRPDDLRVTRFQQRTETSVVFSVDASGSSAMQRLAEAKGAVEQVLVDCYVRRDHVALVSFRGRAATLLLPPTRSLVRVRRSLAELAGGGTTPLAAGIDAALSLALDARQRGQTPVLVLMTDGRANVARDGSPSRAGAEADALAGARAVRAAGVRALFLDTSPRPRPAAQRLAQEMGARYLPLPYLDTAGISLQVQAIAQDGR